MAHSRSLAFLKPLLGGPYFDLEAIWDEHCKYEFEERDVAATMATMVDRPYVNHIPTMTYVSFSLHLPHAYMHPHSSESGSLALDNLNILIREQWRHRQIPPNNLLHHALHLQQPPLNNPLPRLPHPRHRPRNRRVRLQPHARQARRMAAPFSTAHRSAFGNSNGQYYYAEGRSPLS